ncbi:MAG: polysaccharide biosynthesis C-terminal domain-containing protein [Flavisolibacter sp.]
MSTIRKQSIISSIIVYFGFALGLFNTYLFTREGGFTKEEYGLTGTFIAIANIMFSLASFAMPSYIGKFFPYYKAHLDDKKNDQLTWALLLPCIGFLFVIAAGIGFKHILVDKVFNNSPQLLQYYYWIFPFGFGYTVFMVLEAYAWQQRKAVLSNSLREVFFRFLITILIVATTIGIIKSFDTFIALYSLLYLILSLFLFVYFGNIGQLNITLRVSRVTQKFFKKILALVSFVWGGSLVFNVASVIDTIFIAAVLPNGMAAAGIFIFAQNLSSLMQAPQRAIVSASYGPLSTAWKEKDLATINRIYYRSSINQLIFSCAMFCLIWMNFENGILSFHIQPGFVQSKWIFFFLGITRILDMGTGVNAQIISTSTFWRFDFISGLILLLIMLPLNYELTRSLGVVGPAISTLISLTIYNLIRFIYLWRKFNMQPFNIKTLATLVLAFGIYFIASSMFLTQTGFIWIVMKSLVFIVLFGTGVYVLKLSPDVQPVLITIVKRLRLR